MDASFDELIAEALDRARIAIALPEGKDEDAWEAYGASRRALQAQASHENWERIAALATRPDPVARELVSDVLRYFGGIRVEETLDLLRRMLEVESDENVLSSIGYALGGLDHGDVTRELMLPFRRHPSADVRLAVACALGFSQHPEAVAALLDLSTDPDGEVRNWATFFLGACDLGDPCFADPVVCDALAARLEDSHDETRAEAVEGLARRGDARALPALQRELRGCTVWEHHFEAAIAIASAELVPALEALQEDSEGEERTGWHDKLSEALAACRAGP